MTIESEERNLWVAVIAAVMTDIQSTSYASKRERDEAISWVGTFPSRDFRMVCSLAGIEPDAVHWRFRSIIESGKTLPAKAKINMKDYNHEDDFGSIGNAGARRLSTCSGGYAASESFRWTSDTDTSPAG